MRSAAFPSDSGQRGSDDDSTRKKSTPKGRTKVWKIILMAFLYIILLFVLVATFLAFKYPLLAKAAVNFIKAPVSQVASTNGRVNILIMGKSGGTYDGADLTDTMILASVSLNGDSIKLVSIPRDIWVPEIRSKINSAYYWGKNGSTYFTVEETGGGISFARKIVGKITGQPVGYGAVIDFSAFKDIVDALGGIEVNVENSFTDKLYPIKGRENDNCEEGGYACRYETVTFEAGVQKMDGETALKFVRSRHAEGDEGTDIAREARQQKVIDAIKNKVLQPKTYLSIKKTLALLSIAEKYVETDIDFPTSGILARKILEGVDNISQNTFPEDLLVVPPTSKAYDNLYVFIPKAGNGKWEEVQAWFTWIVAN